MQKGIIEVGG